MEDPRIEYIRNRNNGTEEERYQKPLEEKAKE